MDSEKDKKVKRIARFLEIGGTMLAEHCKVCGAPKFRYQGTVICPICDVREEGEAEETPVPAAEARAPETRPSPEKGRPWYQTKEEAPETRPKTWFESKTSAVPEAEERESVLQYGEKEPPKTGYKPAYEPGAGKEAPESTAAPEGKEPAKRSVTARGPEIGGDRALLEGLLLKKLISIAASVQNEKDPRRVAEEFDLIDKGLGLIERLSQG
ncbi:hypothetical protein FTO70_10060 [Methanosarcina sp. KYL-1]|uniref:Sjogren's syndrome/scleroderma autoantigen 1 family protein n=1 Tax=Methanosarcina sp. KYL-1 TaxID=2602068 RepID=UPI00210128E0|nr:Sjogren's syndrome/scleroderma autoantigen 1 family protein [Methanosarcina sp. KYL-1]MCQ1536017.1 hypothetical protein [Methanosarcina sp. KYL-1]